MFWGKKKAVTPPVTSTPLDDISALGPVVRHNHVAYVPARPWSLVPGVGTSNLAYVPDFLLSAPESAIGNAMPCGGSHFDPRHMPVAIIAKPTVLSGVGGIVAGSTQLQQLLEVNYNSGVGE